MEFFNILKNEKVNAFSFLLPFPFYLGTFTFLLAGCFPDPIDIEIKQEPMRLVVASQIIPEKELVVALTHNFSPLEDPGEEKKVSQNFLDNILVKDATVTVNYLGITDTLYMLQPGIYGSSLILKYDYGVYTLNVYEPSTQLVISATSEMLPRVNFDTIYPEITILPNDTTVKIKYRIRDTIPQKNWYVISFYNKSRVQIGATLDLNVYINELKGQPKLSEIELLTDQLFDGSVYNGTSKLGVSRRDTIAAVLSNITEGYYKFLYVYKKAGNIINQLTGEPINYPTNVNNGYGFFNTHNPDVKIFDLNKY